MTPTEEREMHALATQLAELTKGDGWEASRYWSIGMTMKQLSEYCPSCDCQAQRNKRLSAMPVRRER